MPSRLSAEARALRERTDADRLSEAELGTSRRAIFEAVVTGEGRRPVRPLIPAVALAGALAGALIAYFAITSGNNGSVAKDPRWYAVVERGECLEPRVLEL